MWCSWRRRWSSSSPAAIGSRSSSDRLTSRGGVGAGTEHLTEEVVVFSGSFLRRGRFCSAICALAHHLPHELFVDVLRIGRRAGFAFLRRRGFGPSRLVERGFLGGARKGMGGV